MKMAHKTPRLRILQEIDNGKTTTFCGTLHAMAPEVLAPDTIEYGYEVDHWSFGVMLFEIHWHSSLRQRIERESI